MHQDKQTSKQYEQLPGSPFASSLITIHLPQRYHMHSKQGYCPQTVENWFLEGAYLTLLLGDPMHCSPQGYSVHGLYQAKILEWVAIFLLQVVFLTQGLNPHFLCLLHCRWTPYLLSHQCSPYLI